MKSKSEWNKILEIFVFLFYCSFWLIPTTSYIIFELMDYEGLDNIIEILNSKGVPGHHKKAKER